jgi:hypothetical protein
MSFGKSGVVVFVLLLVCHHKSVRFHGFDPNDWSAGREWLGAFSSRLYKMQ